MVSSMPMLTWSLLKNASTNASSETTAERNGVQGSRDGVPQHDREVGVELEREHVLDRLVGESDRLLPRQSGTLKAELIKAVTAVLGLFSHPSELRR
jgi:hypothetical protein